MFGGPLLSKRECGEESYVALIRGHCSDRYNRFRSDVLRVQPLRSRVRLVPVYAQLQHQVGDDMVYGTEFLKITWRFAIVGSEEIADTSLNLSTQVAGTYAAAALAQLDAGDAAAITDLMATCIGGDKGWADYSQLVGLKIAAIGTDGKYLAAPLDYEDSTPAQGTVADRVPQGSGVLSLRAATTFGKGNYGRMYLPHFYGALVTGSPTTFAADAVTMAGAGKTLINSTVSRVNGSITAVVSPVIMSQALAGPPKLITRVGYGDVVDTQRRRRNQLQETYSFATL